MTFFLLTYTHALSKKKILSKKYHIKCQFPVYKTFRLGKGEKECVNIAYTYMYVYKHKHTQNVNVYGSIADIYFSYAIPLSYSAKKPKKFFSPFFE